MKLTCLAFVSLVAVSLAAATPDQLVASGKQSFFAGDIDKATDLFEQAAKQKPNDSNIQMWLFRSYGRQAQNAGMFSKMGLATKAKNAIERAIQLDPNNIEARSDSISYYLQAPAIAGGGEDKALQQAQEIRKRDAIAGHSAFARIYTHQKKPELAKKEFYDAVREQPNSAKAHYTLATYLMAQKDWKASATELETTLKLDPAYMSAVFRIGQLAALSSSDYARGEESLRKYIAYKPTEEEPPLARAWYWLGQIQEKTGRRADARSSYATSLKLMPGAKDVTEALKRVS